MTQLIKEAKRLQKLAGISEIKINKPLNVRFIATVPYLYRGWVKIDGVNVEYSVGGDELDILIGYNLDLLEKYGGYLNNGDENYYPVEESKKACEHIIHHFTPIQGKIQQDDYDVSYISIPFPEVKGYIEYDGPIYKGNYTFEWKGKTIRFERAPELDQPGNFGKYAYNIYDTNNKLIKIIYSPNEDINSYMAYQEDNSTVDKNSVASLFKSYYNT
jgi:hypothetical protein